MNAIERVYSVSVDMEEMIAIETVLDIRALLTEKGISDFWNINQLFLHFLKMLRYILIK